MKNGIEIMQKMLCVQIQISHKQIHARLHYERVHRTFIFKELVTKYYQCYMGK